MFHLKSAYLVHVTFDKKTSQTKVVENFKLYIGIPERVI